MERGKFTWDGTKLVKVEKPAKLETVQIITDECEPFQSMVDGSIWTSKARYRQHLRDNKMIEVGNDVDGFKPYNVFETREYDEKLKEDLTRSYYEVRDGMAPLSEYDKERCKRINRDTKRNSYDRRERDRDGRTRD